MVRSIALWLPDYYVYTDLPISCTSLLHVSQHAAHASKLTDEMSEVKPAEGKLSQTKMFVTEKFSICRNDAIIKLAFVTFQMIHLKK